MGKIGTAGNKGQTIRSDCLVTLELAESGGIQIELTSKVETLYGDSIIELCKDELKFFGIEHANVHIEDSGALNNKG